MQIKKIPIAKLQLNTGQIEGLPKNPRIKKSAEFRKLMNSIKEDPEMLELRELLVIPYKDDFVVIAGNMRLMAMKSLSFTEAPCKILPEDTPVEKLKAITIKDNVSYGDWDWELLGEDWDIPILEHYGLDVPDTIKDEDDFHKQFKKYNDQNAIYPLVPEFEEFNEVFIIVSSNEIDANWLREKLGLQKMKSYKRDEVKKSNIININDLKNVL